MIIAYNVGEQLGVRSTAAPTAAGASDSMMAMTSYRHAATAAGARTQPTLGAKLLHVHPMRCEITRPYLAVTSQISLPYVSLAWTSHLMLLPSRHKARSSAALLAPVLPSSGASMSSMRILSLSL